MIKDIAEFNRLLNIATHYRTLRSGKKIKVSGHRRTYERLKSALLDLRKTGKNEREYGYLMNPKTGIVSDRAIGDNMQIDISSLFIKGLRKNPDMRRNVYNSRFILHNHPTGDSLSVADLINAPSKNSQVFAINTNGSIFRGYIKNLTPSNSRYIADNIRYITNTLDSQPVFDYVYNLTKSNNLQQRDLEFLYTHSINKILHNNDLTHYRYKLSRRDKNNSNLYSKSITSFMEQFLS